MDLRDYSTSLWSQPVRSSKLDKELQGRRQKPSAEPKLNTRQDAAKGNGDRLTVLCQKAPSERTTEDITTIRALVAQLCPFFSLWPAMLQDEMARILMTEVLVECESVLSRGLAPTKMFIVLSGKLHVHVAEASTGADSSQQRAAGSLSAQPSLLQPAQQPAKQPLAVLKRGDTCGEAALLGPHVSHADVLVGSKGAVLLSLAVSDLLHAIKELLGLRQQDRLEFLRCHPLFQGVSLGDLDALAERLSPAYLPPRSLVLPRPPHEANRIYLIAEGLVVIQRVVGRGGGRAGLYNRALAAAASLPEDDIGQSQIYDANTLSVVTASGVVGAGLDAGFAAVTITPVKAYWLPAEALAALPPKMKALLETVETFWSKYQSGRNEGLSRIHAARRRPTYGAYKYKVGDLVMSSIGGAAPTTPPTIPPTITPTADVSPQHTDNTQSSATVSHETDQRTAMNVGVGSSSVLSSPRGYMHTPVSPRVRGGSRGNNTGAVQEVHGPTTLAAKRQAVLHALSARQVLAVMDAAPHRDPRTGLMTSNIEKAALHHDTHTSHPPSPHTHTHSHAHSGRRHRTQQHDTHTLHTAHGPIQHLVPAGGEARRADQPTLGMLHPSQPTWPRVVGGRREIVPTEAPRPQPIPTNFRNRHESIHRRAVAATLQRPSIRGGYRRFLRDNNNGYTNDSDECDMSESDDEDSVYGGKRLTLSRDGMQPSRRLSSCSSLDRSHKDRDWSHTHTHSHSPSPSPSHTTTPALPTRLSGPMPTPKTPSKLALVLNKHSASKAIQPQPEPTTTTQCVGTGPSVSAAQSTTPSAGLQKGVKSNAGSRNAGPAAHRMAGVPGTRQARAAGVATVPQRSQVEAAADGSGSLTVGASGIMGGVHNTSSVAEGHNGAVNGGYNGGESGTGQQTDADPLNATGRRGAGPIAAHSDSQSSTNTDTHTAHHPAHHGAHHLGFVEETAARDLEDNHPHHSHTNDHTHSHTHSQQHATTNTSQGGNMAAGQHQSPLPGMPGMPGNGSATVAGAGNGHEGGLSGGVSTVGIPLSVVLGYDKLDPLQWATLSSHVPHGETAPRPDFILGHTRATIGPRGGGDGAGGKATSAADGLLPAPAWRAA